MQDLVQPGRELHGDWRALEGGVGGAGRNLGGSFGAPCPMGGHYYICASKKLDVKRKKAQYLLLFCKNSLVANHMHDQVCAEGALSQKF